MVSLCTWILEPSLMSGCVRIKRKQIGVAYSKEWLLASCITLAGISFPPIQWPMTLFPMTEAFGVKSCGKTFSFRWNANLLWLRSLEPFKLHLTSMSSYIKCLSIVDGHLAAHSHRVWYRSGWGNNSLNSNDLRVFFHVGKSQSWARLYNSWYFY